MSKTIIKVESIQSVEEVINSSSLIVEYLEQQSKHKSKFIEIYFYNDAQRNSAYIQLAGFVGHSNIPVNTKKAKPDSSFDLSIADWATLTDNQKHR